MKDSEKQDFAQMLVLIAHIYKQEINQPLMAFLWETLKSYDWLDVNQAFMAHVGDPDCGMYMPKPADIIRRLEGGARENAMNAWAEVDRAVRTVGPYNSVDFIDPIIPAVIRAMGGWIEITKTTDDDWPFRKNYFLELYENYSRKSQLPSHKILLGMVALSNSNLGVDPPEPVVIGEKTKDSKLVTQTENDNLVLIED